MDAVLQKCLLVQLSKIERVHQLSSTVDDTVQKSVHS